MSRMTATVRPENNRQTRDLTRVNHGRSRLAMTSRPTAARLAAAPLSATPRHEAIRRHSVSELEIACSRWHPTGGRGPPAAIWGWARHPGQLHYAARDKASTSEVIGCSPDEPPLQSA